MKRKEIKELFSLSAPELDSRIASIQTDLKNFQIEKKVGKLKNSNLMGQKKKDIARLKTVIKIKESVKT